MQVVLTAKALQDVLFKHNNKPTVGLVPTMGALHQGHLSLVKKAKENCDIVVVSIFVNPTQFDKKEDLDKYPQTLDSDLALLEQEDCDIAFTPSVKEMYQNNIIAQPMSFNGLEHVMEGAFRKGHFDGVGTIVKKLFESVNPDYAYFGEKDFQQLQIIKSMVNQLQLPVKIVPCAIYREKDGLAMSSRNMRLTPKQRQEAPKIFETLSLVREEFNLKSVSSLKQMVEKRINQCETFELEYFEIADVESLTPTDSLNYNKKYRAFIAVFAGSIRLIDNMALN